MLLVRGEVDVETAQDLVEAGLSCLETDSPGLVLNLSGVTFLDFHDARCFDAYPQSRTRAREDTHPCQPFRARG